MIVQLMTSLLIISFIIQLAYYFFVFSGVLFYKDTNNKKKHPPVSVIISSRNDALNLSSFLPFVVKQNYPVFEVIVMNDGSDDNTNEVLSNLSDKYNNLKFFESGNKKGNKKQSLTEAIKKARYDYLLFTDSDCRPVSDKWIKNMISRYDDDTEIVIGYGGYETHKTFLNNMIRYETLYNAMQSMSFALIGYPYSAVGRNFSYKKNVFFRNNGFNSHEKILSGDDDLFLNDAADRKNTRIALNPDSKTISLPEKNFKNYIKQKRRHLSAGFYYKKINKFIIGTEILTRFLFYVSFIYLLFDENKQIPVLILFLSRLVIITVFIKLFSRKIKEHNNLFFIPIFDILIPIINLSVVIGNLFIKKKIVWK